MHRKLVSGREIYLRVFLRYLRKRKSVLKNKFVDLHNNADLTVHAVFVCHITSKNPSMINQYVFDKPDFTLSHIQ